MPQGGGGALSATKEEELEGAFSRGWGLKFIHNWVQEKKVPFSRGERKGGPVMKKFTKMLIAKQEAVLLLGPKKNCLRTQSDRSPAVTSRKGRHMFDICVSYSSTKNRFVGDWLGCYREGEGIQKTTSIQGLTKGSKNGVQDPVAKRKQRARRWVFLTCKAVLGFRGNRKPDFAFMKKRGCGGIEEEINPNGVKKRY